MKAHCVLPKCMLGYSLPNRRSYQLLIASAMKDIFHSAGELT